MYTHEEGEEEVMSGVQDHDYCAKGILKAPEVSEVKSVPVVSMELFDEALDGLNLMSPESTFSSHSPAHSTDSGIENGLDPVLACISSSFNDEGMDLTDLKGGKDLLDFDFLLGDDFKALPKKSEKSVSTAPASVLKVSPNSNALSSLKKSQTNMALKSTSRGVLAEAVLDEKNRKNAIAARENRQKKKNYLQNLENEAAKLREENETLKNKTKEQQNSIEKLADEVDYLKSVIANQSTISLLLKNIATTPGISLSSSILSGNSSPQPDKEKVVDGEITRRRYSTRKRPSAQEPSVEDGAKIPRTSRSTTTSVNENGGVCLHVRQNKVSLELCSQCSKKSRGS